MPQFGFYKVGSDANSPLFIIDAVSLDDAKRQARAAIEAEGLDAIRLWVDGRRTIEIRKPATPEIAGPTQQADKRGARMAARQAAGASLREIADEFSISKDRVSEILARSERRVRLSVEEPNRAALSVRALNALPHVIDEPETDPAERDRRLPSRVAALTKRQLEAMPNLGKRTVLELETWLWERGLTLSE